MKDGFVGVRLNDDLFAAFCEEATRRKQTNAALLRTFVRDGLARYDSYSEQVLQNQIRILEHLATLQDLVGAAVHLDVEQNVLGLCQDPNETPEAYKTRLQSTYKRTVFEAVTKGGRIVAALSETPANLKVSHGH
jgi:hypothetical protein